MTSAVLLALSVALAAACGALAWSHVRRVACVLQPDVETLALSLKRLPAADRLITLRDRTPSDSFERELAEGVMAAPDADAKVAAVNLVLADVDHALANGERWPATALRIALLGGGLLAVMAKLLAPGQLRFSVAIAAVDVLGAVTAAQAGRAATRHVERQRAAADALVSAALALPPEPSPTGSIPGKGRAVARRRRRP